MSSLSMATAVWARNCAGAAASTDAMPIAATVKYSLALSLMVALLVQFLLSRSWPLGSAASVRAGCDSAQSLSPRNKPRRESRSIPAHADGTGSPHPALPKARGKALERTEEATQATLHDAQNSIDRRGGCSADCHDRAGLRPKLKPANAGQDPGPQDAGARLGARAPRSIRLFARAPNAAEREQSGRAARFRLFARPSG